MNERTLRPEHLAAAAVMIGGLLLIVLPRHGMTIVRLVIVTVAAAAGLYALVVNAPPTWWVSPFDRRTRRERKARGSDEWERIRSKLSGRRQQIANGAALPPAMLGVLQPLIRARLEHEDGDPDDEIGLRSARGVLSPLTWAVLTAEPLERRLWLRTLRPDGAATADVVDRVLDDLERVAAVSRSPNQDIASNDASAT